MKHNVYMHDTCNNYFNIEYTVNNSDTEGGENLIIRKRGTY